MLKTEDVDVAIVGAGPTGLMAAEIAAKAGRKVVVFDRMRQPGRKFLLAGSDGLNLTFDESLKTFRSRYDKCTEISPILQKFTPKDLRGWADGLGAETFVGSSGRVFPKTMKASPLLRAWLTRLFTLKVEFRGHHHLMDWTEDCLVFDRMEVKACTTVLALGGASWPRFGTDGSWQSLFAQQQINHLHPSNCQFPITWSHHLWPKQDGAVLKNIAVKTNRLWKQGDIRIVARGLEGAPVYAASAHWQQHATITLDLLPRVNRKDLEGKWAKLPEKLSTSTKLKRLGLKPAAIALVNESKATHKLALPADLKSLPLKPSAQPSFERAISTRGGLKWSSVDSSLAYKARANTYIGGEMLDWDAPTGGYLLQACFSSGYVIGKAIADGNHPVQGINALIER